ncbi:unnamed protein product, partial [Ectocarpus sp. 6 AP-2014]
ASKSPSRRSRPDVRVTPQSVLWWAEYFSCPRLEVHQGFIRPRQRDASRAHGFHDVRGAVACEHCPPVPTGHGAGEPILPHHRQYSSNRKLFADKRPSYQDLQQADRKDHGLQGGGHPKQDGHQSEIPAGDHNDDFQDQLRQVRQKADNSDVLSLCEFLEHGPDCQSDSPYDTAGDKIIDHRQSTH